MSFNIMNAVKPHLTPNLISKASSFLNETNCAVGKAISGILPIVLSSIISKSSYSTQEAKEVFNMADESNKTGFLNNVGDFFDDDGGLLSMGSGLLKSIFRDKTQTVIDSISEFSGVNQSSAHCLLSIAAPVTLSAIGKYSKAVNLNFAGLASLLNNERNNILNMLPGGLNSLSANLGFEKNSNGILSATGEAGRPLSGTEDYANEIARSTNWVNITIPILLLALALIATFFFMERL